MKHLLTRAGSCLPGFLFLLMGSLSGAQTPGQYPPTNPMNASPVPAISVPSPTSATSQTSPAREQGSGRALRSDRQQDEDRRSELLNTPQDPLTEFQQMVSQTTGRQLPIFGASLFRNVPSTFAPVDDAPVTPDYVIGPGDELRLQVWGQVNENGSFIVDRTGAIQVPQLGTVHVAGVRFSELTAFLRSQFERVYRNFELNVNMGQLRSIQVFVVGQARRPGSYTIGSMSTLLNALFESGGPLPQGSLRDIQVNRAGKRLVDFDLYDLLLRGDKSKDVALMPGDVIFIPTVGAQVALVGSVNNPAIYELRNETSVAQLLDLAGGKTSVAAGSAVRLERVFEHQMRSIVQVDLEKADAVELKTGDIVSVNSIVDRFKDAVTLRGNVANPGRYVWHSGMRISDLIPNPDALVTRNYWIKRNQLGQMPPQYEPVPPPSGEGSLQLPADANRQQDERQRGTSTAPTGGNSVGVALTQGTGVFSARTDVVLSAPDIDWSYAVVERQDPKTLETSLLPFNLGKIVKEGDQSQNLELIPGDVVTIFSTADLRVPTSQQTRFVRLEGEFASSGVYSVRPGETLRQLLTRAGGFTSDAYLYASEFTRESTRRVEQQRLREYADQLDAQVSASTAATGARALNDRDAAGAQASASDARAAIARLRQLQPIGRIVLQLKPDSHSLEDVPDLALEDGDRFVVPRVPSSVTVEGQVYSANAFVFERGKHTRDYLRLAGGPDRQADRRRAFVLRADGSVYSRQYGNVEHALIFPGDTIVMPPTIQRRALLRELVDVANIIGQFGIGVAAINVLR